jgi:NAD(P)H-dependent FMN reductase
MKKVLAICGSTRTHSANLGIIRYVENILSNEVELQIFDELSALPHFNPDLDNENAPEIVERFRIRSGMQTVYSYVPRSIFSVCRVH